MATTLKTVVLIHGYFRTERNMRYLAQKLEQRGFHTFSPTLPTIRRTVRECSESLAQMLEKHVPDGSVVHFVGHSMGGLIIRDYLSRRVVEGLGSVVLIGTPNGGTPYANLLLKLPFMRRILISLPDLAAPGLDIALPCNEPAPKIGIVLGIKPDFVRKFLLPEEHDGLVTAKSIRQISVCDEMSVPCMHEFIHWRADTAEAVASFLETGKFNVAQRNSDI